MPRYRRNRKKSSKKPKKPGEDESDLPGFFYDKVKKRYFKIISSHDNPGCSITKDTIRANENSKKISEKLQTTNCNIVQILQQRQLSRQTNFTSRLMTNLVKNSRVTTELKPFPESHTVERLDWSDENILIEAVTPCGISNIYSAKRNDHLDLNLRESFSDFRTHCFCLANNEDFIIIQSPFELYNSGRKYRLVYVTEEGQKQVYLLSCKNVWCVAWSSTLKKTCYGMQGKAEILDPLNRKSWFLQTDYSDVLSCCFGQGESNYLIFNGSRPGKIYMHDTRNSGIKFAGLIKHGGHSSVITNLYCQNNMLLSADYMGNIFRTDLRNLKRPLLTYGSSFTKSRVVNMAFNDRFLASSGVDGSIKVWDINTGNFLFNKEGSSEWDRPFVYWGSESSLFVIQDDEIQVLNKF